MTAFRFWVMWYRLGRVYWSGRHLWTLRAWFESLNIAIGTTPARSVADEMQDWLRERERERVNPEDDGA